MTPTELGLIGIILGMTGVGGGALFTARDKVSSKECDRRHVSDREWLESKFQAIETQLNDIKASISDVRKQHP